MDIVFTAGEEDEGTRLDVFLAHHSGLSRSQIKKYIDNGHAFLGESTPLRPSYHITREDVIKLIIPAVQEPEFLPEKIPLDIVFQDEHIIVINKPHGMVVHPGRGNVTGTLASALLYHCNTLSKVGGALRPGIVHRLDKDTSGLIVAALNDEVHRILSQMLHDRNMKRMYTSFVWGHPNPESGTIDAPIGRNPKKPVCNTVIENGKPAVTHYETVERYDFLSKLNITLQTGRTHQIRVHLSDIGHHVFGDTSYGGREERLKGFSPDIRLIARRLLKDLARQALHAGRLEFKHPATGEELCFEIPLPDDLKQLEQRLKVE